MVWCDRDNAIMSNGVIMLKCGCTSPQTRLHSDRIVPAMRSPSTCSNPQSTFRYTKDNLKILLRTLSIKLSKLLPFYIPVTCHFMSGFRMTQLQYTHQKKGGSFWDLISCWQEHRVIQMSRMVILYMELEGISYEVHRFFSTELEHFEEFSE